MIQKKWDYLIVTASNRSQTTVYENQLKIRRELGLLAEIRNILVVPDFEDKRIGSGGSTILCLLEVLKRELSCDQLAVSDPRVWEEVLKGLKILILHAGGDSKRLPAYGPCGKLFVPVPGESDTAIKPTLFDRQLPIYLKLPSLEPGTGQVVITSGDVLVRFDPAEVRFNPNGVTGLGSFATPEQASRHGVFCINGEGQLKVFLQKPSLKEQAEKGAIDRYGQAVLDIGVMNFNAATAARLLAICQARPHPVHGLLWSGRIGECLENSGLDFYREICCAMGGEVNFDHYYNATQASGSKLEKPILEQIFAQLSATPFTVQVLPHCDFLDFGTSRQLIHSGLSLLRQDRGIQQLDVCLNINNRISESGGFTGKAGWIEGCSIDQTLILDGDNIVVGADIDREVRLPAGICLDVLPGFNRTGEKRWFVRWYGINDTFKETVDQGATFCNRPVLEWLSAMGAKPEDLWPGKETFGSCSLWDARLFSAESCPTGYHRRLGLADPARASAQDREAWRAADRYSLAEIAFLTDYDAFLDRRKRFRAQEIRRSLRKMFRAESEFSAKELAYTLGLGDDRTGWLAELICEACWHFGTTGNTGLESLVFSRIIHAIGSSVSLLAGNKAATLQEILPGLKDRFAEKELKWLQEVGLYPHPETKVADWSDRARALAFENFGRTIVFGGLHKPEYPKNALRSDEIVWGRAPARLDIGGGWTDTPPYALERGGCVLNAAVNLNGQPPIQAYARVIREPVIRINSIDVGDKVEISNLEDLLDYRNATSTFGLAKAALALSGFSPESAHWPNGATLSRMLELFGGGIELTTLAAIPKGSGLGTSSIIGAVILGVIQRIMGRTLSMNELFYSVLRLEQALTTGGGWQDQVGGVIDGVKVVATDPGLIPEFKIHYVPSDVLDPATNGGKTLLYYTGITRLAKNILQQVVGRYLDRDRLAMATLRKMHRIPLQVAEAMARKDFSGFGRLIGEVWDQNKTLDPDSTNPRIEELLHRITPHLFGSKLLGAGGGGFLLMVCKSAQDAAAVREMLEKNPPNDRARFFEFDVSREGLVVTVC